MSDGANARYLRNELSELKRQQWRVAAVALIAAVAVMHFSLYRPMRHDMKSQIKTLNGELTNVRADLRKLTGARNTASNTNNLLSELRQQRAQMTEASKR